VIKRPLGCLFEVVETLVLTVVIFLVIQNFVAQPYRVEQESMQRTLDQGQYLLVDKLTPRFDPYSRGDIVVFTPPNEQVDDPGETPDRETGPEQVFAARSATPFIKRVIGLPGERIELRDGAVFVNGHRLDEPYVFDGQPTEATGDRTSFTVPLGAVFVMGDHRANSTDSRVFGPIPSTNIIGRAWLRYWPITTLSILQVPGYPGIASDGAPSSGERPDLRLSPADSGAARPALRLSPAQSTRERTAGRGG
jgi:signal peptidase I